MDRPDVVQSASEPEDSSWIEDVADRVLSDPGVKEQFLLHALSPVANNSRNLRNLVSGLRNSNVKQISRSLGYLLAWPPGSEIRLGDVGSFASGVSFVAQTQLSALGIAVPVRLNRGSADDVLETTGDVTVRPGEAGTRIDFGHPGATFLSATDVRVRSIVWNAELEHRVISRAEAGEWLREWRVVTETAEARLVVVLVAKVADAYVEFRDVDLSIGALRSGGERPVVSRQEGMQFVYVSRPAVKAVPLFRLMKVDGHNRRMTPVNTFDDV